MHQSHCISIAALHPPFLLGMSVPQDQQQLLLRLNPFELPDTLGVIGSYLQGNRAAIYSCCLVSKAMHQAFRPLLWEHLRFSTQNDKRLPSYEALQENIHFVKSLQFKRDSFATEDILAQFTSLTYPRLKEVEVRVLDSVKNSWTGLFDKWSSQGLIQRHEKTLQTVILRNFLLDGIGFRLVKEVSALQGLRELCLISFKFFGIEARRAFWAMCTQPRLEKLIVMDVDLLLNGTETELEQEQQSKDLARGHLNLQGILISSSRFDPESYKQLGAIMTRSPNLMELSVSWIGRAFSTNRHHVFPPWIDQYSNSNLSPPTWHYLTDVDLNRCPHMSDRDIATVLASISTCGLRRIGLNGSKFGQESLNMLLEHHGRTLTALNLGHCKNLTSPMLHTILCTCERLVSIVAQLLMASDLIPPCSSFSSGRQESGRCDGCQPWVCKDLKEWDIGLSLGSDQRVEEAVDHSPLIFARLAGLKKLQRLHVKVDGRPDLLPLEFRLDRGLVQLESLQLLQDIQFYQDGSSAEDLAWMSKTFSKLGTESERLLSRLEKELLRRL